MSFSVMYDINVIQHYIFIKGKDYKDLSKNHGVLLLGRINSSNFKTKDCYTVCSIIHNTYTQRYVLFQVLLLTNSNA